MIWCNRFHETSLLYEQLYSAGYGKFDWPETFLERILDCDGEMTQSVETELKLCDGTKTGTMQLLTRLQPRCKEYE